MTPDRRPEHGPAAPPARLRDLSRIAPLIGLVLLTPPVIALFAKDAAMPFGAPPIVVYLFGVWLGLIAVAAWLGRALRTPPEDAGPLDGNGPKP